MRVNKTYIVSIFLICLGQVRLAFPYGNLQFKDDQGNTVNSLWDGRSYDSTLFPDGIPWLLNDWDPNEVFDFNLSQFQSIANEAFETWEQVPDANMAFVYDGLTANGTDGYGGTHSLPPHPALDGDNVILFDDLGTGVLGLTCIFTLSDEFTFNDNDADPNNDTNFGGPDPNTDIMEGTYPAGTILDADIILNKDFSDYSITGERGKYDLQAVLVHEIGHFVGLCHSCVRETPESEATMFPFANSNPLGLAKRILTADDKSGVSFYYPSPSFATNLGSISGTVTRGGSPQCGPHVYAIKNDDRSVIVGAYSDESGNYTLQGLSPGDYILRIEPLCVYKERINEIVESQSGIMLYNFMAQIYDNVSIENSTTLISVNAGIDSSCKNFNLISPQDDPFESDDTIATAHLLEANGSRELHHMIYNHDPDYYRDIDHFKFYLNAGILYRILTNNITLESQITSSTIRGFHNSDTTLRLYDVDKESLIRTNDDSARGLLESLIYFIPEHSGIYYLSVSHAGYSGTVHGFDNYAGSGGNYDITITPIFPKKYYVSATSGKDPSVISGNAEPFAFSEEDNLTLSVDDQNEQEILFSAADSTASEVVNAIKEQTNDIDAYVTIIDDLKYVRLVSQRGGLLTSPEASIQVTGGIANSILEFPISSNIAGTGTTSLPWKSIQYAINSVNGTYLEPVVIRIASGTYYENIETDGYDFIFGGYDPNNWVVENSPYTTEIDGMGLDTTLHLRGHTILNNVGVTGGLGKRGELFVLQRYAGGVRCYNSPTISLCRIFENSAGNSNAYGTNGGGVFFWGGGPQIIGNRITENIAEWPVGYGGGIYIAGIPNCMIRDNYIVNNSARIGAGLHNATYGGSIYVSANIIAGNSGQAGAGIMSYGTMVVKDNALVCNNGSGYSANDGSTILEGNVIASNFLGIVGYITDRTKHINNWIIGNQTGELSPYNGGGIYHSYGSSDSVYCGNIIVGNYAKNYGGGVYWGETRGGGRFIANTIAHNSSEIGVGGGLYSYKTDGSLISNNIFAYNNGSGVYEGLEGDVTTQYNSFFGNLVYGYYDHDTATGYSTAAEINTFDPNQVANNVVWLPRFKPAPGGTAENITYNPDTYQSVLIDNDAAFEPNALARLTINPDPNQYLHFYIISNTETTITTWGDMTSVAATPCRYQVFDYHFLNDSRNINVGMDVSEYTTTDIDGQPRPLYSKFDIGADEVFPIAGDFEPDEDVDVVDFSFWTNYWLNPCTPPDWCQNCDIDKNGIVDITDYAKFAAHWLYGFSN